MVSYAVELAIRYDGLVMASFPDLPGVAGLGRDDEEALSEAQGALKAYAAEGGELPEPVAAGTRRIEVPLAIPLAAV